MWLFTASNVLGGLVAPPPPPVVLPLMKLELLEKNGGVLRDPYLPCKSHWTRGVAKGSQRGAMPPPARPDRAPGAPVTVGLNRAPVSFA